MKIILLVPKSNYILALENGVLTEVVQPDYLSEQESKGQFDGFEWMNKF